VKRENNKKRIKYVTVIEKGSSPKGKEEKKRKGKEKR